MFAHYSYAGDPVTVIDDANSLIIEFRDGTLRSAKPFAKVPLPKNPHIRLVCLNGKCV